MEECKFANTCRTCLAEGQQFNSIFLPDERTGTNVHLSEMVAAFSSVQITLGDGLPEEICPECADKTVVLYLFKQQVEECDIALKKKCADLQESEKVIAPQLNGEEELVNSIQKDDLLMKNDKNIVEGDSQVPENFESYGDLNCTEDFSEDEPDTDTDKLLDMECKEFECDICARTFKRNDLLIRHKIAHAMKMHEYNLEFDGTFNMDEDNTIIVNDNPENIYCCDDCKSIFIQKEDLDSHLRICESKGLKYICQVCFKKFGQQANLTRHMRCSHSKNKKYSCSKCTKTFKKAEQLNSHLKVHSGIKPHTCEICYKGFNQISNLKDHMRTHNGEKPFLCSTCGKGFNQLGNLRQHTIRHSGIKAHLCSTCGNGFASKGELSAHLRKHTGARPFVCPICNHGFTTSSSLTKHKRIHSGEKPYECDVCHMKFSRSGILARHKRTHTGEKPYICKYCGKAFIQSNDLTSHLRIHTGEKPYICHICGQAFRQSSALKTHKKTHLNQAAKELLQPKIELLESEPIILP